MGTLKPIHHPTFLDDIIRVLRGHQEVPDGSATLKMYLGSQLITYILKAFVNSLGIGDHYVDVAVSLVSVLGLINTTSVVEIGLESV